MEEKKDVTRPIDKMFELLCENEKIANDLINVNRDLVLSNESLATDLIVANKNLALENEKLTSELIYERMGPRKTCSGEDTHSEVQAERRPPCVPVLAFTPH